MIYGADLLTARFNRDHRTCGSTGLVDHDDEKDEQAGETDHGDQTDKPDQEDEQFTHVSQALRL